MANVPPKKLILSGVVQLALLVQNNPSLLNIPGLASLKVISNNVSTSAVKKPGCSACQKNKAMQVYNNARPQMEAALQNLSIEDYQQIKKILGLDEFCYYYKLDGNYKIKCIK